MFAWVCMAIVFNFYFFMEIVAYLAAFGPKWVIEKKKMFGFELCLQVLAFIADYMFIADYFDETEYAYNKEMNAVVIVNTVFMLRSFRLIGMLTEWEAFDKIMSTFTQISTPVLTMILSLYTIYYSFANLGGLLFGGGITTVSRQVGNGFTPPLYYLMNFNDFGASLVTLFHIMIVNNWYVTCEMYVYVFETRWCVLFFLAFWVLTVLIMLNLVISFVLEIYGTVSSDVENEF